MVVRITAAVCLAFFMGPCYRLSFTERRVIGTWEYDNRMDAVLYYVFHPDHTFELVSADDMTERQPARPLLVSEGTWRVESGDIIIESSLHIPAGYTPKHVDPPKTDRIPVRDLLTLFHSHRAVSYPK
jgi:hypothetical protein